MQIIYSILQAISFTMLSYKYLLQNTNIEPLWEYQQLEFIKCISGTMIFTAHFKILIQRMFGRIKTPTKAWLWQLVSGMKFVSWSQRTSTTTQSALHYVHQPPTLGFQKLKKCFFQLTVHNSTDLYFRHDVPIGLHIGMWWNWHKMVNQLKIMHITLY